MISAVTTLVVAMSNLFLYCLFGKLATESHLKMSDCVYNLYWYKLPTHLQKYVVVMIQNMQQPRYFHGFGVIYLNLETFTSVSMNAFCSVFFNPDL